MSVDDAGTGGKRHSDDPKSDPGVKPDWNTREGMMSSEEVERLAAERGSRRKAKFELISPARSDCNLRRRVNGSLSDKVNRLASCSPSEAKTKQIRPRSQRKIGRNTTGLNAPALLMPGK